MHMPYCVPSFTLHFLSGMFPDQSILFLSRFIALEYSSAGAGEFIVARLLLPQNAVACDLVCVISCVCTYNCRINCQKGTISVRRM